MNRFSKENIASFVKYPIQYGIKNKLKHLAGVLVDFSGVALLIFILFLEIFADLGEASRLLIFLAILIQTYLFYISLIKFNKIKITNYTLNLGLKTSVKFIFLSDLHLGSEYTGTKNKRLNKIINILNSIDLDLIIFGGDFLCKSMQPELLSNLSKLKHKFKFAVYGNHDAKYLKQKIPYNLPTQFINDFKSTNIELLINTSKEINLNGVNFLIGGIPDLYSQNFNIDKTFNSNISFDVKMLVSHNPDIIDFIEDSDNINIILSGHNHSGQIYFPVLGAILPMPTKRRWLTKGIFKIGLKTKLILSCGIGYMGSTLTIGTTSEICIITLN